MVFRCMLLGHYLRGLEYRVELMQLLTLSKVSNSEAQEGEHAAWDLLTFFSPSEPDLDNSSCGFKHGGFLGALLSLSSDVYFILWEILWCKVSACWRICCMQDVWFLSRQSWQSQLGSDTGLHLKWVVAQRSEIGTTAGKQKIGWEVALSCIIISLQELCLKEIIYY